MQNRLSIVGLAVTLPFWLAMLGYALLMSLQKESLRPYELTPSLVAYGLFPMAALVVAILNSFSIRWAARVPGNARTIGFLSGRRRLVISLLVIACSFLVMLFHGYRYRDELFAGPHMTGSGAAEELHGKYYRTQHGTIIEEISREQFESAQNVNRSAGVLVPIFMVTLAILLFMNVTRRVERTDSGECSPN